MKGRCGSIYWFIPVANASHRECAETSGSEDAEMLALRDNSATEKPKARKKKPKPDGAEGEDTSKGSCGNVCCDTDKGWLLQGSEKEGGGVSSERKGGGGGG